jgi:hypothetical protein
MKRKMMKIVWSLICLQYFGSINKMNWKDRRIFTHTVHTVQYREEVFMEGPLEPNMGPSLADVLLCTFESTNAGFSSFPLRKLLSWE